MALMFGDQKKYKLSVDSLELARKFYLVYDVKNDVNEISETLSRKSLIPKFNQNLSWSHYIELMRVKSSKARQFYEIEAVDNNWSARELKRQIGSLLFERLLKSKDKEGLLKLSYKGQEVATPEDVIKDPIVLEFLNLPESHRLVESKVEEALIDNLQKFLLELGKGFAFVPRQKRLTLEGDHFYADLVFYHVILKCYIIVELLCVVTHNNSYVAKLVMYYIYSSLIISSISQILMQHNFCTNPDNIPHNK